MITTGKGDDGTTQVGTKRVSKASNEVEFFGLLDELIAMLGYSYFLTGNKEVYELMDLVKKFFDQISSFESDVDASLYKELEERIKVLEEELPEINKFIKPKGKSACIHIARTKARALERAFVRIGKNFPNTLKFLNRLSDYLFLIAYKEALKRGELETFK